MQQRPFCIPWLQTAFQSSSGPKTGCNPFGEHVRNAGGRVSILIRPEDRMQRSRIHAWRSASGFQSSSGPKTGCNLPATRGPHCDCSFNPHPARRPDATGPRLPIVQPAAVSILIRPEDRMQHGEGSYDYLSIEFQSSSGPKTGCNFIPLHAVAGVVVSILIRPEDRMQPYPEGRLVVFHRFQSSSGPKTGCNGPYCVVFRGLDHLPGP